MLPSTFVQVVAIGRVRLRQQMVVLSNTPPLWSTAKMATGHQLGACPDPKNPMQPGR